MKAKRIDHVVIAVQDLQAALETYQQNFGLEHVGGGEVPSLGIRNALLQIGDAQLELITPLAAQGPVASFLAKQGQGGGLYLLALEVENLDDAIATLQAQGARINSATGAAGQRLVFVSPRATHGVLLQLLERREA